MKNKFKPNKWQIEFIQELEKSNGRLVICVPRRAGLKTIIAWLKDNNPELYEKYLKTYVIRFNGVISR